MLKSPGAGLQSRVIIQHSRYVISSHQYIGKIYVMWKLPEWAIGFIWPMYSNFSASLNVLTTSFLLKKNSGHFHVIVIWQHCMHLSANNLNKLFKLFLMTHTWDIDIESLSGRSKLITFFSSKFMFPWTFTTSTNYFHTYATYFYLCKLQYLHSPLKEKHTNYIKCQTFTSHLVFCWNLKPLRKYNYIHPEPPKLNLVSWI